MLESRNISWAKDREPAHNEDARFLAWVRSFTKGKAEPQVRSSYQGTSTWGIFYRETLIFLKGRNMCPISLSDIYKLEYDDQGIGEYHWVHPKLIQGYTPEQVREIAKQKEESREEETTDNDFEDTPDTLITNYLCTCLDWGNTDISPMQYIDALLYLITELSSSYACYILGSTHYHNDKFISPNYAMPILSRLRRAFTENQDKRTANLIRDLTLEIFHMGYPWEAELPRFHQVLQVKDIEFIKELLQSGPIK